MKRSLQIIFMLAMVVFMAKTNAVNPPQKKTVQVSGSPKVEIYYFHYTRRCETCQAVETETQKAIKSLYPALYKAGKITFRSVNLDENSSKNLSEKYKVEGQSLLIISGSKRIDLTDTGFLYARSKPEKLKQELKKVIEPLIK